MDKLGVLDQVFYKADQYKVVSMIMGGVSILAPAKAGEQLKGRAIANHLATRLGKIPLLRKKLVQDPLRIGSVRKIDDPAFDIWDHISVVCIPKPGGYRELTRSIANFSAEPLGLSELWHWTVLEGLEDGKLAVACKIHHALADGLGVVEVLSSIYDPKPVRPEKPPTGSDQAADEPTPYTLLGDAIAESTRRLFIDTPRFVLRNTGPLLSALGSGVKEQLSTRDNAESKAPMPSVQATSLNITRLSDKRSVSWQTLSLSEVKTIARHFGCTINDIGLLLYSFALESYFEGMGEAVDFDLWCGVPISTRTGDSKSEAGNQVTGGRVSLHNTIADPLERLRAISVDARETKQSARPEKPLVDMVELGGLLPPAAVDGILYLAGRFDLLGKLGARITVINALLSNVPGPPTTIYIANAVLVESIPLIPAVDVLAVSGGIVSTEKTITIGFHCDGEAVEDPGLFVQGVNRGMNALRAAMKPVGKPRRRSRAK